MMKAGKRVYNEVDYDSTKAKKSKSSKSKGRPAQVRDVHDSDEDLEKTTSVKFLAATRNPAKRSRAAVSNFKDMVEAVEIKLAKLLEEKALAVPKRDLELKNSFIKVVEQVSTSKSAAHIIEQNTKFTLASSLDLLEHYQRASQQVEFGKDVPVTDPGRKKDNETLQRILNRQEEIVKSRIRQLLDRDAISSKERVTSDSSELDTNLWKRFAVVEAEEENVEARGGRKEETWNVVARNAQRGVRRLVVSLPADEK